MPRPKSNSRALIVVTSHDTLGTTGKATGYYLPEVAHPYAALRAAGIEVDIASPSGGEAPLDQSSLKLDDPVTRDFWEAEDTREKMRTTIALADVDPSVYQAVLFAGGHGTMWDFANEPDIDRIAREVYEANGVVAAVCHGPAALIGVRLSDGTPLVKGRQVGGFSNLEEELAGLTQVVPFLLESALVEEGGKYCQAEPWQAFVVVDDRLITGQNPASAAGVGAAVARRLAA